MDTILPAFIDKHGKAQARNKYTARQSTGPVPQAFNPQLRQPMQASPQPGNVQNQTSQHGQAQRQMANGTLQQMIRTRAQELISTATQQQLENAKQFSAGMPAERHQQLQAEGRDASQVYFTELARKQLQE